MTAGELQTQPTEALERRRGELAQGLQMAALEGLPLDADDVREVAALDAELKRRSAAGGKPAAR